MGSIRRLAAIGIFAVVATAGLAAVDVATTPASDSLACDMNLVPYDPYHQTCGIPNQIPTAPGQAPGGRRDHRLPQHSRLPVTGGQRTTVRGGATARHQGSPVPLAG